LLVVTAIGLNAARHVKTAADFAVGGRASGVPLIVGTIIGTIIGGSATVGTAQLAFTIGFSAWWFTLGAGIALLLLAIFYARPLRASGYTTIPQFLVAHYGPQAGPVCSISASLGIFFSLVSNILAATPLVGAIFGTSIAQAAGIVFLLIVAYVFFGGVWGTGLVGIFKTVLTYITLIAITFTVCREMGGLAAFTAAFPAYPWFSLFGRGVAVDVGSALALIVGTLTTQTYVQAIYAAKDVETARRGAIVAALITLPSGVPAVMAGMFMRVHHPDIAPINALPLFILNYLPPWLGGIAIATLLLAAIGSAAGLALGIGTMLSRDIVADVFNYKSERLLLWVNRGMVLAVTLAAALFTFGNLHSMVLQWNFLSMGLRGAGTFLPLTAAIFMPNKIRAQAAVISIICATAVLIIGKLVLPANFDPLYLSLAISAIILAFGRKKTETDVS